MKEIKEMKKMKNCIFCKIINKEEPEKIVYENAQIIAFNDINPIAPVHILVVPKKHIDSVAHFKEEDKELIGELILACQEIANNKGLKGYKLAINVGKEGGQIIDHIHIHLISKLHI